MIARSEHGFTLIELLVVLGIVGLVAAVTYVTPQRMLKATLETESRQLHTLFDNVRRQAVQQSLPKKIIRSGSSLLVVDWKRAHSGWFAADDLGANSSFSTQHSLDLDRPEPRGSKTHQADKQDHEIFRDPNEESFIFWPDGTSTGVDISLTNSEEKTRYISVSLAGTIALR